LEKGLRWHEEVQMGVRQGLSKRTINTGVEGDGTGASRLVDSKTKIKKEGENMRKIDSGETKKGGQRVMG